MKYFAVQNGCCEDATFATKKVVFMAVASNNKCYA